jgi:7,8-dihydroneopterin aldolase/epimerase/oxygenase
LDGSTSLSDAVEIRGLRVFGKHGADPGERDRSQPFEIDVRLEVDLSQARRSDALEDTVDYAAVDALVRGIVTRTSFALLERLGAEILDALLADERVAAAEVTIAKPGFLHGATPSVHLSARR